MKEEKGALVESFNLVGRKGKLGVPVYDEVYAEHAEHVIRRC